MLYNCFSKSQLEAKILDEMNINYTSWDLRLQRAINCIQDFCDEWSLKINVAKTKIAMFETGGKLSRDEKWSLGGEEI
jgi:hypothetical protein